MKKIIPVVSLLSVLAGCSDDPADCNMTSAVEFYIQNNDQGRQRDVSIDYIKSHIVKKIERTGYRHNVYGTPVCKVTYVNVDYENDLRVSAMYVMCLKTVFPVQYMKRLGGRGAVIRFFIIIKQRGIKWMMRVGFKMKKV